MILQESEIFKLLSSDLRRRILAELCLQPRYVTELTGILNTKQPKVSHQIKPLVDAGIVYLKNVDEPEEFGKRHIYALQPEAKKYIKQIIELATRMCA